MGFFFACSRWNLLQGAQVIDCERCHAVERMRAAQIVSGVCKDMEICKGVNNFEMVLKHR